MPLPDCVNERPEEQTYFRQVREGDFVIEASGAGMLPWHSDGALLLVPPYRPLRNGHRVIAVLGNGAVAFKVFAEKDDKFFLFSVNAEDGQDLVFRKDDFTSVRAIYLVIQSMRDERALERAMTQKGIRHFWQEKLKALRIADS